MSARTVLSLRIAVGGTGPSPGPIGSPRSSTGFFYAPPSDHGRALRVTQRPDAGDTWINCHSVLAPEMPHGGARHSGFKHVVSRVEP